MASETTVGAIVGTLRLDADQFHREIERAIAEVDALDGKKATVKVNAEGVDRAAASTKRAASAMDDATVSSRRLSDATDRVKIAELKLMEAQDASKPKASSLLRAQQDLTKARRAEQDAIFSTYDGNVKLSASEERVAQSTDRAASSSKKADTAHRQQARGMRALATAIVTVGPAIIPLAAATVGLAAGFGAMGTAGVFAIVGIKHEMAEGTAVGRAYSAEIDTLKGNVDTLGRVAAKGVLAPFQSAVASLQGEMPNLTRMIGEFSTVTGKTAAALTTGLVASFVALEPLMRDVATYTFGLSERFRDMMTGPGVVTFGDYVRSVFPQVMQAVEALVGAAVHLVTALAPLGMGILTALGALSNVISAIPVDVLAALATTASSVFLGFKSYGLISGMVGGLGTALRALGFSAEAAATGMSLLTAAAAGIGAVIAVATFLYTKHAEAVRKDQQAVNDMTDALVASNGAITENIRLTKAKELQDSGWAKIGADAGIGLDTLTSAFLNQGDAADLVTQKLLEHQNVSKVVGAGAFAQKDSLTQTTAAFEALGGAQDVVTGKGAQLVLAMKNSAGQTVQATVAAKDLIAAQRDGVTVTSAQDAAQASLAGRLDTTTQALQTAQDSQKKTADAASAATVQMQLENDAAGLLKQSLDALSGKALSSAQAQNAFDQQLVGLNAAPKGASTSQTNAAANATDRVRIAEERLADARKKGTTGTRLDSLEASLASARRSLATANGKVAASNAAVEHSLTGMSKGAVDNRGKILGLVQTAQQLGEAYGNQVGSSEKGRLKLIDLKKQIVDNAVATGMNRKEAQKYIDTVFKIPGSVPPTKFEVDTKAALDGLKVFQTAINALTGKTVQIYATAHIASVREAGDAATANAMDTANRYATNAAYGTGKAYQPGHKDGTANANGNIFRAFASGGFENHVAQIAPAGAMRLWAEPETGGEAYIPLAPAKRARSAAILEETNRMMGDPLGVGARQPVGSRTTTINVTHTGNVVAADPATYAAQMEAMARHKALAGNGGF